MFYFWQIRFVFNLKCFSIDLPLTSCLFSSAHMDYPGYRCVWRLAAVWSYTDPCPPSTGSVWTSSAYSAPGEPVPPNHSSCYTRPSHPQPSCETNKYTFYEGHAAYYNIRGSFIPNMVTNSHYFPRYILENIESKYSTETRPMYNNPWR